MQTSELIDNLMELDDVDTDALNAGELFDLAVKVEEMTASLHAKGMLVQSAAHARKVHRERRHRSAPVGMASLTRLNKSTCSRHLNQADLLVRHLPSIYRYYDAGLLNADQVNLICSYARRPELAKQAVEAQPYFLSLANEQWQEFQKKMLEWATVSDDTDPQDQDEKAHLDRRMVWGQGLGLTILAELSIPNDMFEQMLVILQPVYDRMFHKDWHEAKLAKGEDPTTGSPIPADSSVTHKDLARSDRQRWLDALFLVLRCGGGVTKQLRIREGTEGEEIDLNDLDPGTLAEVVIVCDQETIEREIARQNGDTLPPRTEESLCSYRCETNSGLQVTPATALKTLEIGHFRRMLIKPSDLDFTVSRLARFFGGAKRLGLQIRDRRCVTDGCGAPISQCEADHVTEHSEGGETVPINGQMLCGPCHRHKTWLQARGHWEQNPVKARPVGPSLVDHD